MKQKLFKPELLILLLLSFGACSSIPLWQKYRLLDGDAKALFISYYPFLRPSQRLEVLNDPEHALNLLKSWRVPPLEPSEIYRSNKLTSIVIEPKGTLPVQAGTEFPLKAFAYYDGGKKVDVTRDVQWKVLPDLAKIKGSTLKYECAFSDVSVSANFFDEAEGKEVYQIRKPLRSLRVQVAELAASVDSNEYIRLKLVAECQDGTSQDVSCLADWTITPAEGKFLGCGNLHMTEQTYRKDGVTVSASYGGKGISQFVPLPPRKRN